MLSSISVSSPKVNYNINDTFVKPTVTATYSDGHTADVTNSATFTGYDMSQSGSQTVTVSYTEDNETKTVNYTSTIVDNRPIPVSIDVSNIKSEYVIGEAFTPPTVTVTYSDGSTADVTSQSTFSGFNSAADGRIAITVSYTERGVTVTTVFYVRITAPASGGCKGNITATSVILSSLSLVGIVLLILRKRKARV